VRGGVGGLLDCVAESCVRREGWFRQDPFLCAEAAARGVSGAYCEGYGACGGRRTVYASAFGEPRALAGFCEQRVERRSLSAHTLRSSVIPSPASASSARRRVSSCLREGAAQERRGDTVRPAVGDAVGRGSRRAERVHARTSPLRREKLRECARRHTASFMASACSSTFAVCARTAAPAAASTRTAAAVPVRSLPRSAASQTLSKMRHPCPAVCSP
jgi:hypothetical protein